MEDRSVLSVNVVDLQLFHVAENSAAGTVVGTVQATQDNPAPHPLSYAITGGNDDGAFSIDASTGQITVADGSHLDFETHPGHDLTVSATSQLDPTQTDSSVVNVQLTDVHAPAVVTLGGGDATLALVNGHVHVTQGSTVLYDAPREDVSTLLINGSGAADHLTVDYSAGDPIPDGGLVFNGLDPTGAPAGGGDTLSITGTTFDSIDFRYDNGHDGAITPTIGGHSDTIAYTGLEPVNDFTIAATKTFHLSAADDDAVLEDLGGGTLRLRSTTGTFESTTFTAPTDHIEIFAGDGDDTVTVTALSQAFSVDVDGEAGGDHVSIDGALALGSAATTGDLTLSAEWIDVIAPIDTTAGQTGHVHLTATTAVHLSAVGGITAAGNVTIDGGAALATAADIHSLGGDLTITDATTLSGDVSLAADVGGIFFTGPAAAIEGPHNLRLSAGGDIGLDAALGGGTPLLDVTITTAANVHFGSSLDAATLTQLDGTGTTALDGPATLATVFGGTAVDLHTAAVAINAAVNSTGGELRFVTDAIDVAVGGSLDATAVGIVTISGRTAGLGISLGTEVPATLGLSTAELNRITADVLRVGGVTSGNITIGGSVSPANFDTLHLATGGTVAGVGPITIAELAVEAVATLDLAGANDVDRLAVSMAGLSQVNFSDTDDLSIDTVDGVVGLVNLGTTVLTFGAGLTQAAGADVATDRLQLNGTGDVTLTNAGNDVRVLAANVTGTIDYVDVDVIEIGTVSTAGVLSQGLTVTAVDISVTAPIDTTTGGATGDVHLTATRTIDLTVAGAITAGGDMTIDGGAALTTTADIHSVGGDITITDATTLSGDATLTADVGGIFFSGAAAAIDGPHNLGLSAGGDIGFDAAIGAGTPLLDVTITTAANVTFAALSASTLTQLDGTGTTTFGGAATLATAVGTALDVHTAAVTVNAAVASTGGELHLLTDAIEIAAAGSLDATAAGVVTVSGKTAGLSISLGTEVPATLALSTDELNRITADVLRVGDATSGNITLGGTVNPTNFDTLHLTTGGTVTGGGPITISELAVDAAGTLDLSGADDVDRLAVSMTGVSQVTFNDTDDLSIDTVDGVVGLVNPGTTVLTFGAGLAQAAGADVATDQLQLNGAGDVTLTNPNNDVQVLAANVTGTIDYVDLNAVEIGTVSTAGVVANGLTVTAVDIRITAAIDTTAGGATGDVHLTATNTIDLAAAGDITAGGNVTIDGGAALTTAADIRSVAGDITITDATTLSGDVTLTADVGGISFSGAAATIDGARNLTLSAGGDIRFDAAIGGGADLLDVRITTAANATFSSSFDARSLTQVDGTGTTTFNGAANFATLIGGTAVEITTAAVTVNAAVASIGGELRFFTDAIDITATGSLAATLAGIVTISGKTTGLGISLGVEQPAGLALSTAELNRIAADIVRIGQATSGDIAIGGSVSPTNFDTLHLTTGGTVTGAGPVVIAELAVEGVGTLDLAGANDVDRFAVSMTGVSQLTFNDTDDLPIGTVDGVAGLVNPGTTVLTVGNGLTQAAAGDVVTDRLQLNGGGDATLTNPNNDVRVLAANLAGQIDFVDLNAVEIGTVSTAGVAANGLSVTAVDISVTAPIDTTAGGPTGEVHLTATNTIDLAAAGDITAGGNVTIDGGAALTTAAVIRALSGDITITDATTLAGDVTLTADVGGIFFSGAAATIEGPHNLGLWAGGDIELDAAIGGTPLADVTITTAVNVTFGASLDAATLTQLDGTGTTTFNGTANLATALGGTAVEITTAAVTVNAAVASTGGELRFFTDAIDITATGSLDATAAGIVTISGNTAGRGISLGMEVPATLGLSTAELDRITADVLRVGDATSGNITIGGSVSSTNFDTLHVVTGGTVTGGGPIVIAELAVEAVGTLDLSGANDVDRLAVSMTGLSQVKFNDTDDLSIDTVDGVVGLVNSGTTALSFGAGLTQAAGADVVTDQLQLGGTGDVTLTNPNNDVRVLAANVTGKIDYVDLNDIEFGTVNTAGIAANALTVTAVDIRVTAPIDTTAGGATGDVHVTATNTIDLAAAGDITAGGGVTIDGGAALTTAADIRSVAGDITISDATTLAGNVSLRADIGGIFFTGAAATIDGPFNLDLSAGGDIRFDGAIGSGTPLVNVTIVTAVDVTFGSSLDAATLTQFDGTGTTTFNGAANLATAFGGTAVDITTAAVTINAAVASIGGEIRLFTDTLDITAAGALNATAAGIVTISGKTAGLGISLGTEVPATLALSTAELNRITADIVRIGLATSGNIEIGGSVSPTNFDTLHLTTGGMVTGVGPVTIAELAIEAAGTLDLQGANDIDRLALVMTGVSQVDFNDIDDLQMATVDGVDGLVNPGTTVLTFGAGLTQAAGADVATDQLQLTGTGDVTLTNPNNDARVLAANVAGNISCVDVNAVEIGTVNTAGVVSRGLTVSAVDISVTAAIDTTAGGATGVVHLTATGTIDPAAAADITAGGNVTIDGGAALTTATDIRSLAGDITISDATTLTGNVSLTSDIGGVFFTGAAATIDGPFNLDLSAGGDIGFDGAIGSGTPLVDVTITTALNVTFGSSLDAAMLTQLDGAGTTTFGGAATLATAVGTALDVRTAAIAISAAVASTGGELHLLTDTIDITAGGSLDATAAGVVTISGKTSGLGISLGTEVPATLALSTAELNRITADIVRMGDATSGNITVGGLVSPANFDTLHLATGGTVTGVGPVVIAELAVEAAGTLDLQGANDVDRLAVSITGVSQVDFNDMDDLAIDKVDGVIGLVNPGVTVLTVGNGLTQAAGADVITDELQLNGTGDVTLTNPNNDVRVLAANLAGQIDYVDLNAVEIGTVNTAGIVANALTVTAADISVTAPIDTTAGGATGVVHLTATNTIDLAAAGDITAGGDVTIDGGAALTTAADIHSVGGDVTITDATTLTGDVAIRVDLGSISFSGPAATIDGAQNLTLAAGGDIEFDAPIGAAAPLLDVTVETATNVGFFDSLDAQSLTQFAGTGITLFGGPATLTTALGGTALDVHTAAVLVNDAVASTGGELKIFTDQIVITAAGSLDATAGGIVAITGYSPGRRISLGANLSGFLGLSTAELDRITADVLRIGDATSGNIRIPGLVNPLNVDTLHLTSGGAVFGNGSIVTAELAVEAVGAFVMGGVNDVDRLAVLMTGPSLVAFADANDLAIDTVDGVSGITNRPGITLLAFGGDLTQSPTGDIVTGQLGLDGLGSATLLNPGNDVRVLAGLVDGGIQYRDANDLEIGTVEGVAGLSTVNADAVIVTGGNLLFSQAIDVRTAGVHLISAGAIDDAGGGLPKVIAAELEMVSLAGIGVTNPLETDVDRLAAQNGTVGAIRIHDVGGLLSINAVGGTVGVTNLGGGIEITHVGPMHVDAPIVETGGNIKLTTVADGGDDDHLVINAPMLIAGGTGSFDLHGGTDLVVNDTGILNDIQVAGSGSLVGTAGRNVILGSNVRIRSATGAIENIPPLLSNVNGPQVESTGQAYVSFDYGRLLELNFRTFVDWSDGTTDFNRLATPGSFTAGHIYTGNPDIANPAAPITITVTLLGDDRIHFTGYEQITISTQVTVPGTGLQIFVRIDTSPKIAFLGFPPPPKSEEPPAPNVVTVNNTLVAGGGGALLEVTGEQERVVILRAVSAAGKEGDAVRFDDSALDDLEGVFKKLRDGRYRVYLFEPDTQQLRLVIEVYILDGKPAASGADLDGGRDRPDGSSVEPADDGLRLSAADSPHHSSAALSPADVPGRSPAGEAETEQLADDGETPAAGAALALPALFAAGDGRWARRVDEALARFRDRPFVRSRMSRPRHPR